MNPIARALADKSVIICVGAGGVGKTTVAATLALRSALEGKASMVCTIDPARRLADSLGLPELGNAERRIPDETFQRAGLAPKASMSAMMLDMKQSWDELVKRYAPADKQARILQNRFYQTLSSRLAGSQEYIAMEKLHALHTSGQHAMVVLDTPPTAHALDFLEAPHRMLDFLDSEAARFFLNPALKAGKVGFKLLQFGGAYVAKTIAKFTGAETLQEIAHLLQEMGSMQPGFRERAEAVRELLASATTGFVLVTEASVERIDEAVHFHTILRQNHMEVVALVVNRTHPAPTAAQRGQAARLPEPLRAKVEVTLDELSLLAEKDRAGAAQLARACTPTPLIRVPRFAVDVHDLAALWSTGEYLLGERVLEIA